MNLLVDAARWLTLKVLGVALIVVVVGGLALVWDWEKERRGWERQAAVVRLEVETALRDWRELRSKLLHAERALQQLEASRPNPILNPSDYLAWRARFQAAEAAVEAARTARDRAKTVYDTGRVRLAGLEQQLATVATEWQASVFRHRGVILISVTAFLLAPFAWSAFWYFAVAPLASRARPLVLLPADPRALCRVGATGKVVTLDVVPERPLVARMDWVQQYAPGLEKRTRFLFTWHSPLISYASGLREMTEVRVRAGAEPGRVSLTSATDPNAYLLVLELNEHPGVVLRPGVVVALAGDIQMRSRWRLGSLHAWVSGRVRHVLFSGTGLVVVTGHGGVDWCAAEQAVVIEEALVLGADGRTAMETVRTETFWPYFRGRTSLFDLRFSQGQSFLRQTAAGSAETGRPRAFPRTLEGILNGVGKLLGF
ncbi:MAG: hypothetical protein IT580_03890 [Verrucomicrobiales bacterium]|nr:hypothetical protein [Verrucomicrobiales bacterium]